MVVLDDAVVAMRLEPQERDAPLVWRTAATGGPALAPPGAEAVAIHRGLALRPWAPAHLKAGVHSDGAIAISWFRRARTDGDGWDREPPLNEEAEIYLVEIVSDSEVRASFEVSAPSFMWTVEQQLEAFPEGLPATACVRVRQRSATYGWGEPAEIVL